MASITQSVPTYATGGISQQPDHFLDPGQVLEALNVTPEITTGLVKRPGTEFIEGLTASEEATFFHYYRDQSEQYIGQIEKNQLEPTVKLWPLKDLPNGVKAGQEITVNIPSIEIKEYLQHVSSEDLQFLTINDYTYIINKNAKKNNYTQTNPVAMSTETTDGWGYNGIGDKSCAYVELKKTSNAEQYGFNLYDPQNTDKRTITSASRIKAVKEMDADSNPTYIFPMHTRNGKQWTAHGETQFGLDPSCPDIGTRVYSFGKSTAPDQEINLIQDANGSTMWNRNQADATVNGAVFVGGWNTSHARYSGTEWLRPRNLVWRYTVKGVQGGIPEGGQSGDRHDYTCTYSYDVDLLHGGENWQKGDVVQFTMPSSMIGQDAITYKIEVEEITTAKVKSNIKCIRPAPPPFDSLTAVTGQTVLGGILDELDDDVINGSSIPEANKITAEIIGNGIYIKRGTGAINGTDGTIYSQAFNIDTADTGLMNIMTSEVNDVSKLPTQCKHNYIVKVNNSEADEDDYFMQFIGRNNADGPGHWQECPKPGISKGFDASTMPLQLVRQGDGTFTLQQPVWPTRGVGDDNTNGEPSFVGQHINKMLFWRNRIIILSGTNIIASQPGDNNITEPNFWVKTALTLSPEDVIDLSASSDNPAFLYDGLETTQGLLVFSENQQFLFTAEAEVLDPATAKLTSQSTYNYNIKNPPLPLGTTVGFLDNAGSNSRLFEMVNIQRGVEPQVVDQSSVVPSLLPKNIDLVTNSRENFYLLFTQSNTDTVYGYRYRNAGDERIQSAWFKWKFHKAIRYHAIIDDTYYLILSNDNLVKLDLKKEDSTAVVNDFRVHLDNYSSIPTSKLDYNIPENKTTFNIADYGLDSEDGDIAVMNINSGDNFGRYGLATVDGTTATLNGDWSTESIIAGYNFDMEIKLPIIYPRSKDEKMLSDLNASLIIHRLKLALGAAGYYETKIVRKGKPDYSELIESSLQDAYIANTTPWVERRDYTVPTYERNKNLSIFLKSNHPSPTTLYSMSWEGDYSNKFYQRV